MPIWAQYLVVILAVALALGFVLRQVFLALSGKKSKLAGCGSCGGCGTQSDKQPTKKPVTHFIPIESLQHRRM